MPSAVVSVQPILSSFGLGLSCTLVGQNTARTFSGSFSPQRLGLLSTKLSLKQVKIQHKYTKIPHIFSQSSEIKILVCHSDTMLVCRYMIFYFYMYLLKKIHNAYGIFFFPVVQLSKAWASPTPLEPAPTRDCEPVLADSPESLRPSVPLPSLPRFLFTTARAAANTGQASTWPSPRVSVFYLYFLRLDRLHQAPHAY
jgi:hypothetical protein